LQPFHRGFYFKEEIPIAIVSDDQAHHLAYSPNYFSFGKLVPKPMPKEDIGFAGIRLLGRINRQDHFDEVAVFLGASYFRSLGRNQLYGLSARGLALKTGEPEGEEFPLFRAFWVELPAKEFHEECLELAAGQRLNYEFSAAKTVKFNIHYHAGGKVLYAVRKNARHARGVYTSRKAQGFT
jgi:glucan biosynthesis protein